MFDPGMTSPEGLRRQAELVARVRAARAKRDKAVKDANDELHQAIKDALDAGCLTRDVVAASGFSRQHVNEIYRH